MNRLVKAEGMNPSGVEMIHTPISFRNLRADEVEVRPAEARNEKSTLLLYQDARCAMSVLDETLGPLGWQKEYYEAKGLLMCKIGIRHPATGEWLWKSDTGSESNIEADKGLASDAFKRAAVSWGIGRELYTAPKIVVPLTDKDMFNGKLCQSFKVKEMAVDNGIITSLTIIDKWGHERFKWGQSTQPTTTAPTNSATPPDLDEKLMWVDDSRTQLTGSKLPTPSSSSPMDALNRWYNGLSERDNNIQRFYDYYKNKVESGKWTGTMNVERLFAQWNSKRAA